MVGLWAEGFESHSTTTQLSRKYASFSGSLFSQTGRVFGNSASPSGTQACTTPSFGFQDTFILGWAMQITSQQTVLNSGARGFYFERGAAEQIHVEFVNNASDFEVRLLRGGTTIATTAENFAYGTWHHFEISVTMNTTTGAYELRHNEVNVLSGSSVNTADSGSNQADILAIRFGGTTPGTVFLDDINLKDATGGSNNGFIGDSVVEAVEVTANGNTNDWVNDSSGVPDVNNFAQVDDTGSGPPDEVGSGGTVSSGLNTDKELYALGNLQQISGTVAFVQVDLQAALAAMGTRTMKFVMRDSGGSEADGDTFTVNSEMTFNGFSHVFNQNEATTSAWDISGVDGLQLGFEVVS